MLDDAKGVHAEEALGTRFATGNREVRAPHYGAIPHLIGHLVQQGAPIEDVAVYNALAALDELLNGVFVRALR